MARIKIDKSTVLTVLVCESCGGTWRACAWSKDDAHDRAVAHEQRTHPGEEHALNARGLHRRRAAKRAATRR